MDCGDVSTLSLNSNRILSLFYYFLRALKTESQMVMNRGRLIKRKRPAGGLKETEANKLASSG